MSRVLVTGHKGFVGTHLKRILEERGDEVTGIDLKDGDDVNTIHLPNAKDTDCVYHLAAMTDAQSTDVHANIMHNVIAAVRVFKTYGPKVVFSSSSMVNYPISPYAITKAAAENFAGIYGCAVVRFCNLYGKGGHSVVDAFNQDVPTITIRGTGEQLRTYAPVYDAVNALLKVKPGELHILPGEDMTVTRVASSLARGRPVNRMPAQRYDILDGRQLL